MLAALSASTGRVRIGTSVLVACLQNPVLLADITGTLQLISNGRLNLGVGVGWDQHEFQNLSAEYKERGAVTDEILEIICNLWDGKKFSYSGKYFILKNVAIATPTKISPPIWIGGNS